MVRDRNFFAFLWHSFWLSLADTFADKNTVLPALILFAGGNKTDIGTLTAIMIGIPSIGQILFASYLTRKEYKKPFLLLGIYLRVLSFVGVALSIMFLLKSYPDMLISIIFFWMIIFSISGAFASVSYSDIVGKSIESAIRKKFFVTKQIITGIGIFISAMIVKELLTAYDFPHNYEASFLWGGGFLFLGAFGFIMIKEKSSQINSSIKSFWGVIKSIPGIIKTDSTLKIYILLSNLIGVTFTLIPFYMAFTKNQFNITEADIGTFLLFQISGQIISNIIWNQFLKRYSYKGMLYATIVITGILPVIILLMSSVGSLFVFSFVFIFTGTAISANKITMEGIIIEISDQTNRALYTAIYNTANITLAILPIITARLLNITGFEIIFIIYSIITLSSLLLINKFICPADMKEY